MERSAQIASLFLIKGRLMQGVLKKWGLWYK